MFTSVTHPESGDEIQFKCGRDDCDRYAVGDEVDWHYDPLEPLCGKLLDGAYHGESFRWDPAARESLHTGHWWVVVKGHRVVAVEPAPPPADSAARARVEARHGVELPPLDAWTEGAWAARARRQEESRRRQRQWDIEDYGLTPEERAARHVNRFTRLMMAQDGFAGRVLAPAPAP